MVLEYAACLGLFLAAGMALFLACAAFVLLKETVRWLCGLVCAPVPVSTPVMQPVGESIPRPR